MVMITDNDVGAVCMILKISRERERGVKLIDGVLEN